METPSISRTLIDTRRNVTYEVLSDRPLSDPELVRAVKMKLSTMKRKPPPNSECTLVTLIGLMD